MNKLAHYLNQHLLGEVATDDSITSKFAVDGSILTVQPEIVAFPRTTNDIRKLLRFAWQLAEKGHQLPVVARGAGTNITGSALTNGVVASLTDHMNKILEYDPKQRLVRLQPGVSVGELQNALFLQGVTIPALQGIDEMATIGGVIADGWTTMDINSWVEQIEVVLANGDVLQTKRLSKRELSKKRGQQTFEGDIYRKVDGLIEDNQKAIDELRTDSAGYNGITGVRRKDGSFDLLPLIVGSQGTLGIISELILKAEYTSPKRAAIVAAFDDPAKARDVLDDLAKFAPSKVEYFDAEMVRQAHQTGKSFTESTEGMTLLVVWYDNASYRGQIRKMKRASKLLTQAGATIEEAENMGESDLAKIESLATSAFHAGENGAMSVAILDGMYVPIERFEQFAGELAEIAKKRHTALPLYGLPLENTWTTRPTLNLGTTSGKQSALRLIDDISKLVAKCEGSLVGVHGEGILHASHVQSAQSPEVNELFKSIRQAFDPHGILATDTKQPVKVHDLVPKLRNPHTKR